MYMDALNMFSDKQPLTAPGNVLGTKSIDLGVTGTMWNGDKPHSDPGRAYHGRVLAEVTTAFAGGTTIQAQLVMADDAALGTNLVVVQETAAVPLASLKAGYVFALDALPPGIDKRFIGIRYVVAGTFTAGQVTAGMVWDKDTNRTF